MTSVTCHGEVLTKDTHYTISFGENINAGEGTITLTGVEGTHYAGTSKTITFDIEKAEKLITATASPTDIFVDGTSKITVTGVGGRELSYVSSDDNIAVVTNNEDGTATVTGKSPGQATITVNVAEGGNYKAAEDDVSVNVYGNLENAEIELPTEPITYDGTEKNPAVTVKYNGGTVDPSCYSVSYENNTLVGEATVTVAGIDSKYYKNSKTANFTIEKGVQDLAVSKTKDIIYVAGSDEAHPTTSTITVNNVKGTISITGDEYSQVSGILLSEGIATATITAVKPGTSTITVKANYNETGDKGTYDSNYEEKTETIELSVRGIITADMISFYEGNYEVTENTYTYDKTEKAPDVHVNYSDNNLLILDTDYKVKFENNTNAGKASVRVTGIGNYAGSEAVEKTFTINKGSRNNFSIAVDKTKMPIGDTQNIKLTGEEESGELECTSSDNGIATVSDEGVITGVTAGTATISVTVKETGNYLASETKTIDITVTDNLKDAKITLKENENSGTEINDTTYTYDGTEKKPYVSVVYKGETLGLDTDYKVGYENNTNAGAATVIITGQGKFEGSEITREFKINKANLTLGVTPVSCKVQIGDDSVALTPSSTDSNGSVIDGISYSYKSDDEDIVTVDGNGKLTGKNIGETKVAVTAGSDNYETQSKDVPVTVQTSIGNADITLEYDEIVYDGKDKKPDVTVEYGGKTWDKDTHYSVAYSRNEEGKTAEDLSSIGTVTVTIRGNAETGYFTGSTTRTFEITKPKQPVTMESTIDNDKLQKGTTAKINSVCKTTESELEDVSDQMTYSYESDDENVAIVDENGNVTGVEIGKATIMVTAKSEKYTTATAEVDVTVQVPLSVDMLSLSQDEYTYDGTEKKPQVTVTYNGKNWTPAEGGYTVNFLNYINAAKADDANNPPSVTVTGSGEGYFTGSAAKTFTIHKADMDMKASLEDSAIVEGSVTHMNVSGVKEDAQVHYETDNNYVASVDQSGEVTGLNKGVANITVTADATTNYKSASKSVALTVLGNIADDEKTVITLTGQPFVYDNSEIKPTVTVTYQGTELTKDTDYTAVYSDNINAGSGNVKVTGKGGYSGEQKAEFAIDRKSVTVTADDKTKEYGTSDPELTFKSEGLANGDTDSGVFTGSLTRDSGDTPGTYAIRQGTLTSNSNYSISFIEGTFTIKGGKNAKITVDNNGGNDIGIKDVDVNGLDEYAKGLPGDDNTSIEIEMVADPQSESEVDSNIASALVNAITDLLSSILNNKLTLKQEFIALSIIKHEYNGQTKSETEEEITELPDAIETDINLSTSGKSNISVAREHEGVVETFEELDKRPTGNFKDGTYFVSVDHVFIYSKLYSTFAIGYTVAKEETAPKGDDNAKKGEDTNKPNKTNKPSENSNNNSATTNTPSGNSSNNAKAGEKASGSNSNNSSAKSGSSGRGTSTSVNRSSEKRKDSVVSRVVDYLFGRSYVSNDYDDDDSSDDDSDDEDSSAKIAGKGASKALYTVIGKKSARYDSPLISPRDTKAVIPDEVTIGKKKYVVTSVASYAFDDEENIKTVTIGKNVKRINECAFAGAKKLKKLIVMSKKLTKEKTADCLRGSSIKNITVPKDKLDTYKQVFSKDNSGKKVKVKAKKSKK